MSKLSFGKYEGAGNDFILIDDRPPSSLSEDPPFLAHLCDRKKGIGADGVILLQPSLKADFRMRIFNSDGSEAEGCGNGLCCLVRFLLDLGFPPKKYQIETANRTVEAEVVQDKIALKMGPPRNPLFHQQVGSWEVHSVDTGVPHAVIFVPDVDQISLDREAPPIRHHPLFHPRGTNVNFVTLLSSGALQVRTFERGVEGETLACGTGAAAVASIGATLYSLPNPILLHFKGGILQVHIEPEGLRLIGEANQVFEGTLTFR